MIHLKYKPYIIAEIANAHNGNFETLLALIQAAAESGAHAVKFQWFRPETLAMPDFEWYPVYEKLMFTEEEWDIAISKAVSLSLDVWADATDSSSLSRIERNSSRIFGLKIPPSTILERDHAKAVLEFMKPTLVGIGGHEDAVIDRCVNEFKSINDQIILQHGFQGYPTKPEDATLIRLQYLMMRHKFDTAYADHEKGGSDLAITLPQYAFFAGATVLEKHICLDRSTEPYDHYSSLEPEEFAFFVNSMKQCASIAGDILITEAQKKYLSVASRAVLKKAVKKGDVILPENIMYRRTPISDALTPDLMEMQLPAIAQKDISDNQPITKEDVRRIKIIAIVPCRLNSTRLIKKAELLIAGIPSIQRCLINIKQIRFVDKVVLATSLNREDDNLILLGEQVGVEVFRGSEDDVLQRIISIGESEKADIVLRLTGDCPALSFEILEHMIVEHLREDVDLTYCHTNVAVGTVGDVYRFSALQKLRSMFNETPYSEYLSYYFINNSDVFKTQEMAMPPGWAHPEWRLTLDEQADLDLLNSIYSYHGIQDMPISFKQISDYFKENPQMASINQGVRLKYKTDSDFIKKLNEATTLPLKTSKLIKEAS